MSNKRARGRDRGFGTRYWSITSFGVISGPAHARPAHGLHKIQPSLETREVWTRLLCTELIAT